jgi:hypothetical protein
MENARTNTREPTPRTAHYFTLRILPLWNTKPERSEWFENV